VEARDLDPASAAAILDVELAGICGTDVKIYSGTLPQPYPIVPGHEILGRIRSISTEAATAWGVETGDRVVVEGSVPCWSCPVCRSGSYKFCPRRRNYGTSRIGTPGTHEPGALATGMRLASGSIVHPVADHVPAEAAVLASVVANGIAWAGEAGGAGPGVRVIVRGAGAQGIACAAIAAHVGAAGVLLIGLPEDAARLAVARELGPIETATTGEDVEAALERALGCPLADLVVDVSGDARVFDEDVSWLRPQGSLVFAGLSGRTSEVHLDTIVWREIEVRGVFTKNEGAMRAALDLIELSSIPFERIVTCRIGLDAAAGALHSLSAGPAADRPLKVVVDPISDASWSDCIGDAWRR
jgi:alcohol dehydrogenase